VLLNNVSDRAASFWCHCGSAFCFGTGKWCGSNSDLLPIAVQLHEQFWDVFFPFCQKYRGRSVRPPRGRIVLGMHCPGDTLSGDASSGDASSGDASSGYCVFIYIFKICSDELGRESIYSDALNCNIINNTINIFRDVHRNYFTSSDTECFDTLVIQ
jgi:hypothetical protein